MKKEFNIKVQMEERWVDTFCSMLKYMENLGNLGSSRGVTLYSDGDGDFRPKFEFDIDYKKVKPVGDTNGNRLYDAG